MIGQGAAIVKAVFPALAILGLGALIVHTVFDSALSDSDKALIISAVFGVGSILLKGEVAKIITTVFGGLGLTGEAILAAIFTPIAIAGIGVAMVLIADKIGEAISKALNGNDAVGRMVVTILSGLVGAVLGSIIGPEGTVVGALIATALANAMYKSQQTTPSIYNDPMMQSKNNPKLGIGPIPGKAIGDAYIDRTGVYMLHRGEAVTSAAQNKSTGKVFNVTNNITLNGKSDISTANTLANTLNSQMNLISLKGW
jgi:hypothetical protein